MIKAKHGIGWVLLAWMIVGGGIGASVVPNRQPTEKPPGYAGVPAIFYVRSYQLLEEGIMDTTRRQAIYSYIIANISTPQFEPIRYLPADDVKELRSMLPDLKLSKEVILEFVMSKMAENSKRQSSYTTMWKGKKDSLTRIVTLGK